MTNDHTQKAVKSHAETQHILTAAEKIAEIKREISITHKLRS
jgi:hypothetical protein